MERISERLILNYVSFTDIPIPMGGINTLVVMALLLGLSSAAARKFTLVPGRSQYLVETYAWCMSQVEVFAGR